MEVILVFVGIFGLIGLIFVFSHLRPMTENEVEQLGIKRRNKQVRLYFSFNTGEFYVDKEFKKGMNPNGKLYRINEPLFVFPSIAAALLKYKKHEWIIIAFEKEKKIDSAWLNKGFDRSGVSPYLSVQDIANIANSNNHTSILIFHNHPNTNPNYYDCRRPSSEDMQSANECAKVLNRNGTNLIEFVCERGKHYKYFSSYADSFLPLSEFATAINGVNSLSKLRNLSLHIERIF
jgi:hypothetical protein